MRLACPNTRHYQKSLIMFYQQLTAKLNPKSHIFFTHSCFNFLPGSNSRPRHISIRAARLERNLVCPARRTTPDATRNKLYRFSRILSGFERSPLSSKPASREGRCQRCLSCISSLFRRQFGIHQKQSQCSGQ